MINIELDNHPRIKATITGVVLLLCMVFIFFPTFWMIAGSLKPNQAAFAVPPQWIPHPFTIRNYVTQLQDRSGFLTYARNGFLVSIENALLAIIVSVPAGYAFTRIRFPAKRFLLILILASQMFPGVIIVITLFSLYRVAHLIDTYFGLVLAFTSFSLPFAIWMIRGFFATIPLSIDEAAEVDGCNRLQILLRIDVPLVLPGLLAVGLFSFLNSWNNLIFALSLTTRQGMRTIPPGFLLTYVGEFQYKWSDMFAGSVLVTLPTVIIFIALQRFLIKGLVAGATKG